MTDEIRAYIFFSKSVVLYHKNIQAYLISLSEFLKSYDNFSRHQIRIKKMLLHTHMHTCTLREREKEKRRQVGIERERKQGREKGKHLANF